MFSTVVDPLRLYVRKLASRVAGAQRSRRQDVMRELGRELAASLDVEHLVNALVSCLSQVTQSDQVQAFLVDSRSRSYKRVAALGPVSGEDSLSIDAPLVRALETRGELCCAPEPAGMEGVEPAVVSAQAAMREEGLVLCVPLVASGRLLGWFGLGEERSGAAYTSEARQFLATIADQAALAIHNALLYRDSQDRARQLDILNRIGHTLGSTLDLQEVLNRFLAEVVEVFSVEAASLLLVDQDTGELVFEIATGPTSEPILGSRLPVSAESLASWVARTGKPVLSNDVRSDPQWYSRMDEKTGFVTRQLIAVPMSRRDTVIGVVEILNRRDRRPFTDTDTDLLAGLATQAALAIDNARLYSSTDQALAERVDELSMMQRIDRQLNATLDYERVMDLTLQWAVDTTHADAGSLGLLVDDGEQQGMWVAAVRGYPSSLEKYQQELWPLATGIVGEVASTAQVIYVSDVRTDPHYHAERALTQSELAVPVMREERVIGVLNLESDRPDGFSGDDRAFVVRLVDRAAIALENARLYAEVKRANESKSKFVSIVSHELKAPMTIIKGYAELIELTMADSLGADEQRLLHIIMSNVEQMQTLINDLLQLARLESGQLKLDRSPTSFHIVLGEVISSFRHSITEKELGVTLNVPAEMPLVHADPVRLNQVLTNLLSNAVKYTPRGGAIEVAVRVDSEDQAVCCTVRDSGPGISPEDQEHLFERFFRGKQSYVRQQAGTGLGLSISKTLVEMHGGKIWAESAVGKGSSFFFTIPLASNEEHPGPDH